MPVDTHIKRAHPILFGLLILFTLVGWAMCAAVTNHCKSLLLLPNNALFAVASSERGREKGILENTFPFETNSSLFLSAFSPI